MFVYLLVFCVAGNIPSSVCSINQFALNSNYFLCYPSCLPAPDGSHTRDTMPSCATVRNTALCALKSSTNIAFNWACSGTTATTDPCTNSWSHVYCQGEDVYMISIEADGISGMISCINALSRFC